MYPVNLYYDVNGQTVVRYWRTDGSVAERRVAFPAQLLTQPADDAAVVSTRALETPSAVLFAAFRQMPLAPQAEWRLAGPGMSVCFEETFAALLRMLRLPPSERWCVRGEPGWFLQFGFQEADGSYTMGAFVLPCGKPAVLTFRLEDLIDTLPPASPFEKVDILSEADGLPAQCDQGLPWDTRVRLPISDNGAALIRITPCRPN